jgi:hypothetical protein
MRAWYDSTFVGDATRYSRALLGVLIVLWTLGMLFGRFATDLFALTPGYALGNYYVWGQKQSKQATGSCVRIRMLVADSPFVSVSAGVCFQCSTRRACLTIPSLWV